MGIIKKKLCAFFLSLVAVFTLHCNFEMGVGEPNSSALVSGLHKIYNSFLSPKFTDLFVFAAIFIMLLFVMERDKKIDIEFLIFSLLLSVTLVSAISFKKFNSLVFLQADCYQHILSLFCIAGFWIILYGLLRCIWYWFGRSVSEAEEKQKVGNVSFLENHFLLVGFVVIFLGWLPWILMNYPGSGCGDSVTQLRQFFGEQDFGTAHPPLSTVIMGSLLSFGRLVADANFGFFLYCLMQTLVGAAVFSLSMKRLKDLGLPTGWCLVGIFWFALTPFWGTYAQWVEKDLFYTEIALLQTICILDILARGECGKKETIMLTCSSLGAVFLRNNGIHAVLPALIILAVWLKGISRKRLLATAVIVLISYEGVMEGLYPALGMQPVSDAESFSIPFQQTARYVCEHDAEVTDQEREVLEKVFGYDNLFFYDPVVSDPIKINYKGTYTEEYLAVWFRMFWKHPGTYMTAFVNANYGYLAPVEPNIEGWIQLEYYDYLKDLDIHHVFDLEVSNVLMMLWNLSMKLPLAKYLCTPGMYTWIVAILAMLLIKKRKFSALILFVPSFMNILVCLASPLAGAIRYELPTVASVPLLIGWTYFSMHEERKSFAELKRYQLKKGF